MSIQKKIDVMSQAWNIPSDVMADIIVKYDTLDDRLYAVTFACFVVYLDVFEKLNEDEIKEVLKSTDSIRYQDGFIAATVVLTERKIQDRGTLQ
jgi:hypothetical protein